MQVQQDGPVYDLLEGETMLLRLLPGQCGSIVV